MTVCDPAVFDFSNPRVEILNKIHEDTSLPKTLEDAAPD